MSKSYYTTNGRNIHNPDAYAKTGAPMYKTKYTKSPDINQPTAIYKLSLENNKTYIGKTTNVDRRMSEHFSGHGSKVTKKFAPLKGKVIDVCHGYIADKVEQKHTETYIKKQGYDNVRGGTYTNSKTLRVNTPVSKLQQVTCYKCGKQGHYANSCSTTQRNTYNELRDSKYEFSDD